MAGYTRQSSYADGDVIQAADSNDEFNQLLAAFVNSTGHKHDGTAAEGPVIGLIGDPGVTTPLNKVVVDNTNNRVGLFVDAGGAGSAVEQIRFQDGAIVPVTDNDIDLGTSSVEFKDAYFDGTITTDALVADTIDINGGSVDGVTIGTNSAVTQLVVDNININGTTIGHTSDTDLLTFASGILTVAGEVSMTTLDIGGTNVTSTAAELNILDGVTSTASELNILDGVTATASELNILDGVTSTATELNIVDGDTSIGTTAVAGGDGIVTNDAGTLRQTTVDTFDTYFSQTSKTLTNKTLTSAVLNTGVSGTAIKDEDNMASDSATHLATQQSIKAYVDGEIVSAGAVTASSTTTFTNKSLTAPIITGSSTAAGSILFKEDTDNGTNAVTLIGPASTADVTVTLPSSAGTVALTSDIPSSGISSGNVATFTSGAADDDFLRIDGTSIEGRSASEVLSDIGAQASLTFGISDTNAVKVDSSSVADDEYARFTANGLESRSTSEVLSDIGAVTAAVASADATAQAIALG
tara:strand:- start:391 stop:1968 length:1578 start_codon:yes stop_codon:yes gene_type:complete